ncbi:MAG: hypothetical protein H6710_23005 [Myxococcales bacterium]|nr:hypothetical protein [Myxococcales bacterium]
MTLRHRHRRIHSRPWTRACVAGLLLGLAGAGGCGEDESESKLDVMLTVVLDRGPGEVAHTMPEKLMRVRAGTFEGKDDLFIDVFIQGDPSAISKLQGLGATIRTVTSRGIMTATVPLSRVRAMAELDDVSRIEASRSVKLFNDLSNGLGTTPEGFLYGMANEDRPRTGAGVVVGILDTGIDWTHADFIVDASEGTAAPLTRVRYLWDQSDYSDDAPARASRTTTGATARWTSRPRSTTWTATLSAPRAASRTRSAARASSARPRRIPASAAPARPARRRRSSALRTTSAARVSAPASAARSASSRASTRSPLPACRTP